MTKLSLTEMDQLARRWYELKGIAKADQTGVSMDGVFYDRPTADGRRSTTKLALWAEVEADLAARS